LKRLVRPAAKLAFLTGHGERSIYKKGERDYFQFTIDKPFRGSLLNNGFEIMELDLRGGNKIPDDLDILFIADMRQPLQPEEMEEIQHYIARGGNFVLVADAGTQEIVNPIIASLGVQFMENRIVQKTEDYSPSIVFARMTPQSEKLTGWFRWMNTWKYRVPMENAMALISTPTDDVEFIPLIVTDSTNCWNEVETKEYSAKGASLNPDAGECEQQYTMAAQVTRKLANKEQRAFIFGDADFCSNVELHRQRRGVVTGANKRILDYLFLYLTEGEFPVNTDRPGTRDRDVYLGVDDLMPAKVGFMGIFPALIAVFGIAIQIRRKRK
jgi:ABC-2 type transport system permease protein